MLPSRSKRRVRTSRSWSVVALFFSDPPSAADRGKSFPQRALARASARRRGHDVVGMVPRMRRGTLRRQMQRHEWVRARVGRVADRDRVLVVARALVVGRVVVTILPVAALVAVGLLRPVGLVLCRTRNCVLCDVDEV